MKKSSSPPWHAPRPAADRRRRLEAAPVAVSAPCRIDMGGTLDIRTFSYPLQHLHPLTVNIALELRTRVELAPHARGRIQVRSRGFRPAEFAADAAPFRHPLGLIFAVAAFFGAEGVRISVRSESPPRSALGGSSVAAAALVGAFLELDRRPGRRRPAERHAAALIAHAVEESVAGVPCGFQDQLAAVYGGVNAWHWLALPRSAVYRREALWPRGRLAELQRRLLVAYVGVPHESSDINGRWVEQFLSGRRRPDWAEVAACVRVFREALLRGDFGAAAAAMNRETGIRRRMTPDVVDALGRRLCAAARRAGCGARFTGAGGGGCLWALGEPEAIAGLRPQWEAILAARRGARLLPAVIAAEGLRVETDSRRPGPAD